MNSIFMEIVSAAIRSVASLLVLQLLTKIVGSRQMSQLSFYEYIVGITIGSIAAVFAVDESIPFYVPLCGMIIYALFAYFEALLTSKSLRLRKWLTGKPELLIYNGKIIEQNLKKNRLDVNDLLTECRFAGYFSLDDLLYVIMESNGKMSFLPKSDKRPITAYDLDKTLKQETPFANVVIDGVIMKDQLSAIGKDIDWFHNRCKELHLKSSEEMLLAIANQDDSLYAFYKNEELKDKEFFI